MIFQCLDKNEFKKWWKINAAPNLVTLRKKRGWSQSRMAAVLGYSSVGYVALEKGTNIPSLLTILCIMEALECTFEELIPFPPS